jgi:hypothetical protein
VLAALLLLLLVVLRHRLLLRDGYAYPAADTLASRQAGAPLQQALAEGTYPLWNPLLLAGMPSLASLMSAPLVTPASWINLAAAGMGLGEGRPDLVLHLCLAGLGVGALLLHLGCGPGEALLGGVALAISLHPSGMLAAGHHTKLHAFAWLPWALWALARLLAAPTARRTGILALVLGLQFLSAHLQMSWYTWLALGLLAAHWAVAGRAGGDAGPAPFLPRVLSLGPALLLGLLLAAVLLVPVARYAPLSTRAVTLDPTRGGLDEVRAGDFSLPPAEILTLAAPRLVGFGGETYRGGLPFAAFPHYVGVVVLALAVAALASLLPRSGPAPVSRGPDPIRAVPWLALLLAVGLLLACGSNLGPLFTLQRTILPLYRSFRAPSQAMVLAELALAVLGGVGLHLVLRGEAAARRGLAAGAGLVGAVNLAALGVASGRGGADSPLPLAHASRDLLGALVLLGAALLVLRRHASGGWGRKTVIPFLVALAVLDLWRFGPWLGSPRPVADLAPRDGTEGVVRLIRGDAEPSRVLPLGPFFTDNRWAAHGIPSAGGYHAAKLGAYQRLLERLGVPERASPLAIGLLNVGWVISPEPISRDDLHPVGETLLQSGGRLRPAFLYRAAGGTSPAWLAPSYRLATTGPEDPERDPRRETILEEAPPLEPLPGRTGAVTVVRRELHRVDLATEADTPRLLVLSEAHYPHGWRATVDGRDVPILRAEGALRAVALEAGRHAVSFRFAPRDHLAGLALSLAAGGAVLLLVLRRETRA